MQLYERITDLGGFLTSKEAMSYTEYAKRLKNRTSALAKEIANNTGLLAIVLGALGEFLSFLVQIGLAYIPSDIEYSQIKTILDRGFPYDICFVAMCAVVGLAILAILRYRSDIFWARNSKYSINEKWEEDNHKFTEGVKALAFILSYFICFTFHLIVCGAEDISEQSAIGYKIYTGFMLLLIFIFYASHFRRRKNLFCRGKQCNIPIILCLIVSATLSFLVSPRVVVLWLSSYSVFTFSLLEIIVTVSIAIEFSLTLWFLCIFPFYRLFKFAYDARHKSDDVDKILSKETSCSAENSSREERPGTWFIGSIAIFAIIFSAIFATDVLLQISLLLTSSV